MADPLAGWAHGLLPVMAPCLQCTLVITDCLVRRKRPTTDQGRLPATVPDGPHALYCRAFLACKRAGSWSGASLMFPPRGAPT
ncbi:hypothetical protein FXN65_22480 [Metapseudomonas lalkuanensis]|uniref:Uncharacterized protein n=1 Tax=Metapseudomonas lalkuanensis TaxID=2604832 RepID=A0A5J6QPH1_9GAMM|nr:hypothetical protein FXN65_22480 [Pseudomonas lalkuanensis]